MLETPLQLLSTDAWFSFRPVSGFPDVPRIASNDGCL